MKKNFIGALGIWILLLPLVAMAETGEWKLAKNEKGIRVSTRKSEDSPIKAFQGVTTADATVDEAVRLFETPESACQWIYQCSEFKILEDKSPEEKIIYFHQDMPWPVADRDVVYQRVRQTDADTGTVTYTLTDLKDVYPEKKAGVRLVSLNGKWRFSPAEGNQVEILDEQHVDPGGSLPTWLVNRLVVDVPFDTLKEFKVLLKHKNSN